MDSYLIRIYRRDKKNPEAIIGIIEEIGAEKQESFGNLSELTAIISNPCFAKASGYALKLRPDKTQGKEGNQASPAAMPRQGAGGKSCGEND